jgi:hypothetical protein
MTASIWQTTFSQKVDRASVPSNRPTSVDSIQHNLTLRETIGLLGSSYQNHKHAKLDSVLHGLLAAANESEFAGGRAPGGERTKPFRGLSNGHVFRDCNPPGDSKSAQKPFPTCSAQHLEAKWASNRRVLRPSLTMPSVTLTQKASHPTQKVTEWTILPCHFLCAVEKPTKFQWITREHTKVAPIPRTSMDNSLFLPCFCAPKTRIQFTGRWSAGGLSGDPP